VYELARRLDRGRFDVHVAALRGGEVAEWLARAGVGVTVLDLRGKADVTKLAKLVRLLREKRVQILHTHLFHADLAGRVAARLAGVPRLIHTVHVAEGRFRPWQYAWARLTANWCDRIVCVSKAVRDHHARRVHLPPSRYRIIPNGIDAAAYSADPRRRRELRDRWGLRPGQTLIAFVGRLDEQKNVALFLASVTALRHRRKDARVVIAGDGRQRGIVERFLRSGDASTWAVWLGQSPDVAGVLAAADVFVQSSRWEGLPLTVLEAMAAGLPVVATAAGGTKEAIEHGVSGLLVEPGDRAGLTAAIERLMNDPPERERLGRAARRRVNERFSIDANVSAHARLYMQLFDGDA